jgi:hypothetical protein
MSAFTTNDGEEIDSQLNDCSSPPAYETGDTVEIKYNPRTRARFRSRRHPANARSSFAGSGGLGALLLLAGLALVWGRDRAETGELMADYDC